MKSVKENGERVGLRASRILKSKYIDKMGTALGFAEGEMHLILSMDDMDLAISRQPGYVGYIFCKEAECRMKILELEDAIRNEQAALKDLKMMVAMDYRINGLPDATVKVTEAAIEAASVSSSEVKDQTALIRRLYDDLAGLRRKLPKLSAAKAAIESKEKALMNKGANDRKEMDSKNSL